MKDVWVTYSAGYPWTRMTLYAHRHIHFTTPGPDLPAYYSSRKRWAQLHVLLDGIELVIGDPDELAYLCHVFSQKVMPSGRAFDGRTPVGRPNGSWLSRLPSKAKTPKFRRRFLAYLTRDTRAMRDYWRFYEGDKA